MKASLAGALVCPDCRKGLAEAPAELSCGACGAKFPVRDGVPRLWPPSRRAEIEARVSAFRSARPAVRSNRLLRALLQPNPVFDPGARARERRVREAMDRGLVLNLGSKARRWGDHVVNLDLVEPAELVADAERLPFADGSVDGIVCTSVLEHAADAAACIGEIARVLRAGGAVYVTVPFLFPTHPDPLDRWRWTLDGLRHAMRGFEEVESGAAGGPFSACVSVAPTLVGSAFPGFWAFNAVRGCLGWLLWPLKFLDALACRTRNAALAAAGFHYFGRKRQPAGRG